MANQPISFMAAVQSRWTRGVALDKLHLPLGFACDVVYSSSNKRSILFDSHTHMPDRGTRFSRLGIVVPNVSELSATMAFAQRLFEQHGGVVNKYFKRLTGDATAAEDLTQEVFLRVVRSGDAYEHRDRERAWVFRIARNVFIDLRRQALRAPGADSRLEPITAPHQNTRASLREALGLLPADEREAFLLREIAGLSYAEIAAMTDSTVPGVRSRIYRARIALRDMLIPPSPNVPDAIPRQEDND